MIEVTIVAGFLGAGKTTWLSRILQAGPDSEDAGCWAVIVNEYASAGVDDHILQLSCDPRISPEIRLVAGGCVCCDRRQELISSLMSLVESRHRPGRNAGAGVEKIFIETSGVADPEPIVEILTRHPVLQANLVLKELVVVVDALNGSNQLRHHELARSQLRTADRIVISKVDLADEHGLASVAAAVTQLNPAAELTGSIDGIEAALPHTPKPRDPEGSEFSLSETEPTHPAVWIADLSTGISWPEYALWLDAVTRAHPDKVLRTKGTICTPNGPLVLQSVGSVIAQPRTAAPGGLPLSHGSTSMVFLTTGIEPGRLARSLATFVPSAAADDVAATP